MICECDTVVWDFENYEHKNRDGSKLDLERSRDCQSKVCRGEMSMNQYDITCRMVYNGSSYYMKPIEST